MKYFTIGETYGTIDNGAILTTSHEVVYITKEQYIALGGEVMPPLTDEEINFRKRRDYENEVSHLVQQYARLELMLELERLPELLTEITNKTIEIRNRYK